MVLNDDGRSCAFKYWRTCAVRYFPDTSGSAVDRPEWSLTFLCMVFS